LIPLKKIQAESPRVIDTDRKGLPGSVPKMETVGPVSTCGGELLRGWWWPIGLMVSFMIFTASVRNILDCHYCNRGTANWHCMQCTKRRCETPPEYE
jgi:hypothetical protein